MSAWRPTACAVPQWRHTYRFRQSFPTRLSPCKDAAAASRQPYEATDMLADFELAGGRSTDLTQLASPRFEEKQALSARQMEDGKLLDDPRLGGDFRPSGQYGRLDLDVENL